MTCNELTMFDVTVAVFASVLLAKNGAPFFAAVPVQAKNCVFCVNG